MVGNIHVAVREADTVSAHLVYQIFTKDNYFLRAILNPKSKTLMKLNYDETLEYGKLYYEVNLTLIQQNKKVHFN